MLNSILRHTIPILALAALTITLPVSAQTRNGRTELERFYSEKGAIVVIETEHIGSAYTGRGAQVYVAITAMVIYLPGRDDKVLKGIKISVHSMETRKELATAYVDSSELPSLYKAMMYIMKARSQTRRKKKNLHITYMTKGDFSVGYIQEKGNNFSYYYRIKDTENGKTVNYRFISNKSMLKSMKKYIRNGVKYLNSHEKKIKSPKPGTKADGEVNT